MPGSPLAGCAAKIEVKSGAASSGADLVKLAGFMAGSFSSSEQAAADTSYFDIRLRMAPIWSERKDGFWLYVEQAVATHEEKPYRQRVYHLTQLSPTIFESDVFTLRAPLPPSRESGRRTARSRRSRPIP